MSTPDLRAIRLAIMLALPGCLTNGDKQSDSTTTTTTPGTTEPGPSLLGCDAPTQILDDAGSPTGLVRCADGSVNRTDALPTDSTFLGTHCEGTEDWGNCTTDADCTDGPNGVCAQGISEPDGMPYCGCTYTCSTDADCSADQACIPVQHLRDGTNGPRCITTDCFTGADCDSEECGVAEYHTLGVVGEQVSCRTADDTCRTHEDCYGDTPDYVGCIPGWGDDPTAWTCESTGVPGRPMRIDDTPVLAPEAARSDWSATAGVPLPTTHADRHLLAQHWSAVARAEHASVASFARVAFDLMALGAPPQLLADTHAAAADEVRHAERFFALASAVGPSVGPGPLPIPALQPPDPARILADLLRDACINETLAVCQAVAERDACTVPAVRDVLTAIIADETRHAALAWRTLRWLLEAFPHLRTSGLAKRLTRQALDHRPTPMAPKRPLEAYGLLGTETLLSVREDALHTVILPALRALELVA